MSSSNAAQPQTSSAPPYDNDPVFQEEYDSLFAIQSSMKIELAPLFRENRHLQATILGIPESAISIDDIDVRRRIPPPNMQQNLLPWKSSQDSGNDEDEHQPRDQKQRNKMRLLHAMETDIRSLENEIRALEWRNRTLRDRLRALERRQRNDHVVIDLEDDPEDKLVESVESVEDQMRAMNVIRERAEQLARRGEKRSERSREISKMNVEDSTDDENSEEKGKKKTRKSSDEHDIPPTGEKYKTTMEEGTDEDDFGGKHKKATVAKMFP
ncbi:MAG: hypothetical protein Q9216_006492 [Gyalolechia sp. 2 TL-2023]